MNEGVLIRYLGKWMAFWRPPGLGSWGGVRWGELRDRSGVGKKLQTRMLTLIFVSERDFFSILKRFWNDFGGFWEAKMDAKIDFWKVFQKTSIVSKSLFFLRKIAIFKVSGLQIQ